MIQSINFPIAPSCIAPFGDWETLRRRLGALGLDGVEGICDPCEIDESFPADLLTGYHLLFYADWLDFYLQREPALMKKFGSWEMVEKVYGSRTPKAFFRQFRDDLDRAIGWNARYVVFHVADVSLEECYTYRFLHSDWEVLETTVEFINQLLDGVAPTFDFLVENQWWPGFTFTDPQKTEYLLSHIRFPRVGIMLDTGHLMNTNPAIRTQSDGVDYILSMLQAHGSLSKSVKGMHFHQSLSGRYVRTHTGTMPEDFPEEYFRGFAMTYPHIERIDRHRPWTDPRCVELLEAVRPEYLTHELSSGEHRSQLAAAKRQLGTLRKGGWL